MAMNDIPFHVPPVTGDEGRYVKEVVEGDGRNCPDFVSACEDLLRSQICSPSVVLVDSCTSALEISAFLASEYFDESDRDTVILPSFAYPSSASGFVKAGFKLHFVDVADESMTLDPVSVEEAASSRVAAIVAVHYGTTLAPMRELRETADHFGILLIEDAAQALGASLDGHKAGTWGDVSCFSFNKTKHVQCGQGGALCLRDPGMENRARHLADRGTDRLEVVRGEKSFYQWVGIGGSFVPTMMQAAYLYPQLQAVEAGIASRARLWRRYAEKLIRLVEEEFIQFPLIARNVASNYPSFHVLLPSSAERAKLKDYLAIHGVDAYIGYFPLHESTMGIRSKASWHSLTKTEELSHCVLRLPMYNTLSVTEVERICGIVEKYFGFESEIDHTLG